MDLANSILLVCMVMIGDFGKAAVIYGQAGVFSGAATPGFMAAVSGDVDLRAVVSGGGKFFCHSE